MPVCSARVSKMAEGKESWERAKKLLLEAVDVVLRMKEKNTDGETSGSSQTQDESDERTKRQRLFIQAKPGASSCLEKKPSGYEERRRLFGYQPSKVCFSKPGNRKGKGKKKAVGTSTREALICLKDSNQECSPSTEEKIELAQLNLGLRKLVFSAEGDAAHIHVILEAFPILDECGGLHTNASLREFQQTIAEFVYSHLFDSCHSLSLRSRSLHRLQIAQLSRKTESM